MPATSASSSLIGISSPSTSLVMTVAGPPHGQSVATIGIPIAIASRSEFGRPSQSEVNAYTLPFGISFSRLSLPPMRKM